MTELYRIFIPDGGLDEMVEDFNSGKIQYALCRVKIKDKNVQKILLINWVIDYINHLSLMQFKISSINTLCV